ncbi:hypothetical protein RRG08_002522 [Elysia crispata]|uniref:Vitellogenin receptor n=1 Tax=Elysia crispata TaxID=231223 RepID=A0AAE1DVB4_9GAST|nr:hypothetical protein RRG08_002522 [Elysia crispata]
MWRESNCFAESSSNTVNCNDKAMLDCNLGHDVSQCVLRSLACNHVPDCQNGWDESVEICGCPPHEFQCNSSHCIDLVRRCDVTEDCQDGSDELDCETFACPKTHFKCANHKCVPRDKHCDFENDCGDNSDESDNCEPRQCYMTEFQCDNKECAQTSSLCDGVQNCKDGSDENETNCVSEELYIKLFFQETSRSLVLSGANGSTLDPDETRSAGS